MFLKLKGFFRFQIVYEYSHVEMFSIKNGSKGGGDNFVPIGYSHTSANKTGREYGTICSRRFYYIHFYSPIDRKMSSFALDFSTLFL